MNELTKICSKCKINKSIIEFYYNSHKQAFTSHCKSCSRHIALSRRRGIIITIPKTEESRQISKGIARLQGCIHSNCYNRNKNGAVCNNMITAKSLRNIYSTQNGKCFYTGVTMKLFSDIKKDPYLMSVDRIDSSKDYIPENIVLCCLGMNWLKNIHSQESLMKSLKTFYETAIENKKII